MASPVGALTPIHHEGAIMDHWLNHITLKYSPTTAASYRWQVQHLAKSHPDFKSFSAADLAAYLARRKAEGLSDATIKLAVFAFRSYYRFIGSDAAERLPFKTPAQKKQRTLTWQQVETLLTSLDSSSVTGRRNLALIALMIDSGIRAAEVCQLRVDRVDLCEQMFYVVIKGGQESFGVFSQETANHLAAWLADRAHVAAPNCVTLFCNVSLNHFRGNALTPSGLRNIFAHLAQQAGLPKLSPHDLRRTFAVLASLRGAPSKLVMVAGRWHNLKMVDHYTQAITAKDFAPYSPIAGLMHGLFPRG